MLVHMSTVKKLYNYYMQANDTIVLFMNWWLVFLVNDNLKITKLTYFYQIS